MLPKSVWQIRMKSPNGNENHEQFETAGPIRADFRGRHGMPVLRRGNGGNFSCVREWLDLSPLRVRGI